MNKEELHEFIEKNQPNICQIVACKDNQIVYSDTWNDYKKDDCTHIMSATKSIMALLIGIAIDKGQIGSVDDKVLDYFPNCSTYWNLTLHQTESFFFLSKYIIIAYYCPIILTDIIFDFPVWALLASFSTKYPAIFSYRGIVSPFSSTCHLNKFSMDII